jgi:hypothetical protein
MNLNYQRLKAIWGDSISNTRISICDDQMHILQGRTNNALEATVGLP